ncbi:MAG: DUF5777 family beta-barrel protein [Bacteroidia bacterium]|nr:DUF5777 family beta-barrel protein [Bacteroidia bacterium]
MNHRALRLFFLLVPLVIGAQGLAQDGSGWKRSEEAEPPPLELFHSTHAVNLPTATTMQQGNFEFEISHRFIPTIKDGSTTLWGFDGPVNIRLALGYAWSDDGVVTLGRSNVQDNLDLTVKHKLLAIRHEVMPLLVAARAGLAWNTDVPGTDTWDTDNAQWFAQLILNTMYDERFALGIVPSYLNNSHLPCPERQYSFTLGVHAQYYITRVLNVLLEWNPTVTGWRSGHNPLSVGVELETGGHFFKVLLSNSTLLNTTQFLAGAGSSFNDGELHIGFNITRLLTF